MKYHYLIYRVEKSGQRTLIGTAQDHLMLSIMVNDWRKNCCATITYQRVGITEKEWKERYC